MHYAVAGAFITCLLLSSGAIAEPKMVANPSGKGDPDAVTCREPQPVRSEMAMRIVHDGPTICRTNRFWADLTKGHKIVAANGAVVADPRWTPTIETNLQPNYQPPPK